MCRPFITSVIACTALCSAIIGQTNADIVAQFADGNDNFNGGLNPPSVDSYFGMAGGGWGGAWSTAKNASSTFSSGVINTAPIHGGGNYLNATLTLAPGVAGQAAAGRQYQAPAGFQLSDPHTISFKFRPETDFPDDANLSDRYQIWDNTTGNQSATAANNTWAIASYGAGSAAGPLGTVSGNWGFLSGSTSSNAFNAQTFVDTGINVQAGKVYSFEITTDPTSKSWSATISDGVNTFTSGTLLWRNQTVSQAGGNLFWGTQKSAISVGNTMTYSLDNVRIAFVPEPSSFGITAMLIGLLAAKCGTRQAKSAGGYVR